MEDKIPHPKDAFELGRAAAAKLKEHNEELSESLPIGIQTLFSDTEFQEAICESGVVTNQRQTLTPVESYSYNAATSSTSTRMLRTRTRTISSPQRYQDARRSSKSPVSTSSPSPPRVPSKAKATSNSISISSLEKVVEDGQYPVEDMEMNVEEGGLNNSQPSANVEGLKTKEILAVPPNDTCPNVENNHVEEETEQEELTHCLCCSTELSPVTSSSKDSATTNRISTNNLLLRDIFWLSLGMTKFYNRKSSTFPFCDTCTQKLQRLSDICKEVGKLEDEFNSVRNSLCEDIVSHHFMKTTASTTQSSFDKRHNDERKLVAKVQNGYEKIVPGNYLLKEAKFLAGVVTDLNKDKKEAINCMDEENSSENYDGDKEMVDCRFCDETFPSLKSRNNHEKVHIKTGLLKCNICSKGFPHSIALRNHIRTHTNERPYKCKFCPAKFGSSGNLADHSRRHKGFKPFQCTVCLSRYYHMHRLKLHIRAIHPDEKDADKCIKKCTPPPSPKTPSTNKRTKTSS